MASLTGVRIVSDAKLTDYLLNPEHPHGSAKAKFFLARGFSREDLATFEIAILLHANAHPVHSERLHARGVNRLIRCAMQTPDGTNPCVNTVWTQDHGTTVQRLVSAYPQ